MNPPLLVLFTLLQLSVILGQPIFSFDAFKKFTGLKKRQTSDATVRVKPYSGLRIRNDSILMMYYHDQTIAIAEVGHDKLLLSCELIEVM